MDMPLSPQDFLRCVTAALIYFVISITAVAKYSDGAYKAAGVSGCPTRLWRYPTASLPTLQIIPLGTYFHSGNWAHPAPA